MSARPSIFDLKPASRFAEGNPARGDTRNALGQVTRSETRDGSNALVVGYVWDAGGRLVERRLNTGQRTTQSWFEDGSLKEKKNLYNATVLTSHLYTIDNQGRRATHNENVGGTAKNWTYLYDNHDRLASASDGTAETYGYDIFGNRRAKTKSGTTTAYLYDSAHQLSEIRSGSDAGALIGAAVHDADGHLSKLCEVASGGTVTKTTTDCTASGTGATALQLTWNALDHLNTATRTGANAVTESYAYDDGGRRIAKVGAGGTALYLYDGADIHAEWATAISGMPQAKYVHGAGTDEPILRLTGSTSSPAATQAASLKAHVLVGMHDEKFQRAFKKLQGERYQIIEPSFTTDLGYLMPDAQFKSWRFRRDIPNLEEAKAREMADGILEFGLPWLCRIDSLNMVRGAIDSESGWRDVDIPLFELLYGDRQTANLLAQDNLRRLEAEGKPNSSLEILQRCFLSLS